MEGTLRRHMQESDERSGRPTGSIGVSKKRRASAGADLPRNQAGTMWLGQKRQLLGLGKKLRPCGGSTSCPTNSAGIFFRNYFCWHPTTNSNCPRILIENRKPNWYSGQFLRTDVQKIATVESRDSAPLIFQPLRSQSTEHCQLRSPMELTTFVRPLFPSEHCAPENHSIMRREARKCTVGTWPNDIMEGLGLGDEVRSVHAPEGLRETRGRAQFTETE